MKQLRLLPLVLTVLCLCSVVWFIDLRQTIGLLSTVKLSSFLLLCGVAVGSRLLRAVKWNLLLTTQQIRISTGQAVRLNWVGSFFAFWTPAGFGSDAYRLAVLAPSHRTAAVASTLFMERYVGLLSVGVVWLLTLPVSFLYLWQASWQLAVALFTLLGLSFVSLPWVLQPSLIRRNPPRQFRKLQEWSRSFLAQLSLYRRSPAVLTLFFVMTLFEVMTYIAINFLAARSIGVHATFAFFVCAMPPVYLVLRLPISIQGWGFQEGAIGYVLSVGGFNPAAGVAISLIQRVVELLCFVLPGAILAPWYGVAARSRPSRTGESRKRSGKPIATR